MLNMEAVLAGIRVQKDRAMKDLAYARELGNPVKVEEYLKKVSLIDAQIKEVLELFPKFKEEKKNDPGRKVNFSDVDSQLSEVKKNFGTVYTGNKSDYNIGNKLRNALGYGELTASDYYHSEASDPTELKRRSINADNPNDKLVYGDAAKNNAIGNAIEIGTNTALATAGLYGLYKLYRSLKNKPNRTPEEELKMQEAKGKLDAASKN